MSIDKYQNDLMVTIRCITYNHEQYIRQCLESFIMQQTDFRFEAIVHDDASTDGTARIIQEYANNYPDIIKPIFEEENQYSKHDGSLQRIMNAHIHGKYVAMCEGDDYWIDPLKLQKQVDFMERNKKYSMCFHNVWKFENNAMTEFSFLQKDEICAKDIVHDWIIPTCSVLFRQSSLNCDDYYKALGIVGDFNLFINLSCNGRIHYMNSIMGVYRIHPNGATSNSLPKMESQKDFLKQIDKMSNVYTPVRHLLCEQYTSAALDFAYMALKKHNLKYLIFFSLLAIRKKNILVFKYIFIKVMKKHLLTTRKT